MKTPHSLSFSRRSRAFTLVELLAVLGVIAILTAAIVPAVGKVLHNARRAQQGANLRQIAIAYCNAAEGLRNFHRGLRI
ncbi:MAG TPA: type II secretion system protein [Opitutales bacterium]|nr:type II secretion system protein [Opitutales bacterium]